ncbi:MAG TPA: VOC family protein [Halococcus sp.]|nr:VOC family protein [Halococcus sp.]
MSQFTHTRLLVTEYTACFQFYRDVIGFEVNWGNEDGRYADFQTGETTLALFDRESMAESIGTADKPIDTDSQDRVALIFAVDSVDESYQQLSECGVEFLSEPTDRPDWGIRAAQFRDPDGTLIEINRPL